MGFRKALKKSAVGFFRNIIMPLYPKEQATEMVARIGFASLTPDQLALTMDQATVPDAKIQRVRLKEGTPP